MDWKRLLIESKSFRDLRNDEKEKIYSEVLNLNPVELDRKYYRKTIEFILLLLQFKGNQAEKFQKLLEGDENIRSEALYAANKEIEKLSKTVEELEEENIKLRTQLNGISEDLSSLQEVKKSSDHRAMSSERDDSPDVFSDIDRQEELLNNISVKNKHIKRLLKDIDSLEQQNAKKDELVTELKVNLGDATNKLIELTGQYQDVVNRIEEQDFINEELRGKIDKYEDDINKMHHERQKREEEINSFSRDIDDRINVWKNLIQEKDTRIQDLEAKYNDIVENNAMFNVELDDVDRKRLSEEIASKDLLLSELEEKVATLTKNLLESTEIINKTVEAQKSGNSNGDKDHENIKTRLDAAEANCKELQSIIMDMEDENALRAKQAHDAIAALKSYEHGENGLPHALKKIVSLEQRLADKNKKIKSLVIELNTLTEVSQENLYLRQKLGLPENEKISLSSTKANYRKLEKVNERLRLKLMATEEMCLQLKLQKNDLRKDINILMKQLKDCGTSQNQLNVNNENSLNTTDDERTKELPDELMNNYQARINEMELKYENVVEENECLRLGMHQILEKLREYSAQSANIVIDTPILEKLLHALDNRSVAGWYHPNMRIQTELTVVKEREMALRKQLTLNQSNIEERLDEITEHIVKEADLPIKSSPNDSLIDGNTFSVEEHGVAVINFQESDETVLSPERECKTVIDDTEYVHLKQEIRELHMECDRLKVYETKSTEMSAVLDASSEEKDLVIAKITDELTEERLNGVKYKYLKDDFEEIHSKYLEIKEKREADSLKWKKDLSNKSRLISSLKSNLSNMEKKLKNTQVNYEDNQKLKSELEYLKKVIKESLPKQISELNETELKSVLNSSDECNKLQVVDDSSLTCEFILKSQFVELSERVEVLKSEVELKNEKLLKAEDVLKITKDELECIRSKITNQIERELYLKHLIVDLQSTGNDKYLIGKLGKDLLNVKENEKQLEIRISELQQSLSRQEMDNEKLREDYDTFKCEAQQIEQNFVTKINYLKKSLNDICMNYSTLPSIFSLANVVQEFKKLNNNKRLEDKEFYNKFLTDVLKNIESIDKETNSNIGLNNQIQIIKLQSKCEIITHQMHALEEINRRIEEENVILKLREIESTEHWRMIKLLFSNVDGDKVCTSNALTQTCIESNDIGVNTDITNENSQHELGKESGKVVVHKPFEHHTQSHEIIDFANYRSMESQLREALQLATKRNQLVLEAEQKISELECSCNELEQRCKQKDIEIMDTRNQKIESIAEQSLAATVNSLQNLIQDRDATLNKYQEIIKSEREEHEKLFAEQLSQLKKSREIIEKLEEEIVKKDGELTSLTDQIKESEKKSEDTAHHEDDGDTVIISDNAIDDMYHKVQIDNLNFTHEMKLNLEKQVIMKDNEILRLRDQLREQSNREHTWEMNLTQKDLEIAALNEKVMNYQMDMKEMTENVSNIRDIDQLRDMLEEKDKHIQDLTDTLAGFHEDEERRYMTDTSFREVTQLSATNRILNTQLEALRRQNSNMMQREKQSREVIKSLKNQLMKRPVISIKTEKSSSAREDVLSKRVQQMERELMETKEDLRRQTNLLDNRNKRNSLELGLWDKQKRWQQTAEKFKVKLNERENELDHMRSQFNTAKAAIGRLEREKNILESKLRGGRCCSSASCPNLVVDNKYTPAESPDHFVNTKNKTGSSLSLNDVADYKPEFIEALKSRLESQQRRIIALELEGKGTNVMTVEVEKLHERLAMVEAQNLRLEAKNLQLQLDKDMLSQGDENDRMLKHIKHLEEYVDVLKDELAQTKIESTTKQGDRRPISVHGTSPSYHHDQTILALKRVIERLRVENKNLKDGINISSKTPPDADSSFHVSKAMYEKLQSEFERFKQQYEAAGDKIKSLEMELDLQASLHNSPNSKVFKQIGDIEGGGDLANELKAVKEKLELKSQLLEKAKILLSRAAAKEKLLREQLAMWKRRCSELQNVPVIDEISE